MITMTFFINHNEIELPFYKFSVSLVKLGMLIASISSLSMFRCVLLKCYNLFCIHEYVVSHRLVIFRTFSYW